jgi:RNA polymerase primary sigma factor
MKTGERESLLDIYSQELDRLPDHLPEEEVKELFQRAKNDDIEARNQLVEGNLKLVIYIIKKHYWAKLDGNFDKLFLDLIQAGNEGIFKALKKFEPGKSKFSTYARWWIRAGINKFLEEQKEFPIPDEHAWTTLNRLIRLRDSYLQDDNRWLTAEELSELSGVSVEKVKTLLQASQSLISLDEPISDSPDEIFGSLIADESSISPEEFAQKKELREKIIDNLPRLRPREEKTLRDHYGIGQDDGTDYGRNRTLTDIGKDFNVSRERTRKYKEQGLKKLRRHRGHLLKKHL